MSQDTDCIFCKIVAGEIPCFKLHEDDRTIAFMDINPVNPGHALIVHKAHHPDLFDIPPENIADVVQTAQKVGKAVQATLEPPGMNLLQCNSR
jgi:histidine triad (HIT) family protein